jgi:hypothetical protein
VGTRFCDDTIKAEEKIDKRKSGSINIQFCTSLTSYKDDHNCICPATKKTELKLKFSRQLENTIIFLPQRIYWLYAVLHLIVTRGTPLV